MAATGPASPRPFPGDPSVCAELVLEHKLTREEYETIVGALGRPPSYTELGVFSVMWSEHCSYKSSRVHLKRLPTTGPRVIQGPGENAGVVDIGDGFCAVFKMESHNHPSFIEPYQGAATGVGGILRDVFTMGARPIASLDSLRFGRPDHPRTPELLRGVVAGIGGYGNSIGVPTVGGEVMFDERYDGNILVNAFTCGVARTDKLFFGRATGVGNDILYIGAKTGRDGIHGATMASDEFSHGGPSQRPTMQVGDPFMGKLLIEACLELFGMDVLEGIQDMGAAGLTSSSVEMAGRAKNGIEIDLDLVPRRARRMTPYEILLSESQERMLLVAKPGQAERVLAVCKKWDLDAAVIGRVTDTRRWVVKATPGYDPLEERPAPRAPVVVCDLPIGALTDDAPSYDRPRAKRKMETDVTQMSDDLLLAPADLRAEFLDLCASPNIGSRRWIWRQYDHVVRGGTVVRPGSDAAVVRVPCAPHLEKYLAFSVDCNARHAELDPFVGGALAVAESCRNLVCSGAEPIGLTDCLNFGNPERPEVMDSFARAVNGIAAACKALAVPIVSGNVSLYNETDGKPILPTPTIAAVGLVADPADIVTQWFKGAGFTVVLLGRVEASSRDLGGSEYLTRRLGRIAGEPPLVDLPSESKLQKLVLELARAHLLASAHDVSDGGLAVALAECCTTGPAPESDTGARIDIPAGHARAGDVPAYLFGEAAARVVVSVRPEHLADVVRRAEGAGVPAHELGVTGGDSLSIALVSHHGEVSKEGALVIGIGDLRRKRESCLEGIVGDSAPV